MKAYIKTKIGYTSGVYGNTGEQYLLVMLDGDDFNSILFDGQFGHEHRVVAPLKAAGYSEIPVMCAYGKLTRKDTSRMASETEAIEMVKEFINRNQEAA